MSEMLEMYTAWPLPFSLNPYMVNSKVVKHFFITRVVSLFNDKSLFV